MKAMCEDPGVISHLEAESKTSLRLLTKIKCHGPKLDPFYAQFKTLANKANLSDETIILEHLKNAFNEKSPYWDKLGRLLEDKRATHDSVLRDLHNYYTTNVCNMIELEAEVKTPRGGTEDPDRDTPSNASPKSNKKKRKHRDSDKGGREGSPKGKSPKAKFGGAPKIVKADYLKLSDDEKSELRTTGKVKGYQIFASKEEQGSHRCVKESEAKKLRRVGVEEEDEKSADSLSHTTSAYFDELYANFM